MGIEIRSRLARNHLQLFPYLNPRFYGAHLEKFLANPRASEFYSNLDLPEKELPTFQNEEDLLALLRTIETRHERDDLLVLHLHDPYNPYRELSRLILGGQPDKGGRRAGGTAAWALSLLLGLLVLVQVLPIGEWVSAGFRLLPVGALVAIGGLVLLVALCRPRLAALFLPDTQRKHLGIPALGFIEDERVAGRLADEIERRACLILISSRSRFSDQRKLIHEELLKRTAEHSRRRPVSPRPLVCLFLLQTDFHPTLAPVRMDRRQIYDLFSRTLGPSVAEESVAGQISRETQGYAHLIDGTLANLHLMGKLVSRGGAWMLSATPEEISVAANPEKSRRFWAHHFRTTLEATPLTAAGVVSAFLAGGGVRRSVLSQALRSLVTTVKPEEPWSKALDKLVDAGILILSEDAYVMRIPRAWTRDEHARLLDACPAHVRRAHECLLEAMAGSDPAPQEVAVHASYSNRLLERATPVVLAVGEDALQSGRLDRAQGILDSLCRQCEGEDYRERPEAWQLSLVHRIGSLGGKVLVLAGLTDEGRNLLERLCGIARWAARAMGQRIEIQPQWVTVFGVRELVHAGTFAPENWSQYRSKFAEPAERILPCLWSAVREAAGGSPRGPEGLARALREIETNLQAPTPDLPALLLEAARAARSRNRALEALYGPDPQRGTGPASAEASLPSILDFAQDAFRAARAAAGDKDALSASAWRCAALAAVTDLQNRIAVWCSLEDRDWTRIQPFDANDRYPARPPGPHELLSRACQSMGVLPADFEELVQVENAEQAMFRQLWKDALGHLRKVTDRPGSITSLLARLFKIEIALERKEFWDAARLLAGVMESPFPAPGELASRMLGVAVAVSFELGNLLRKEIGKVDTIIAESGGAGGPWAPVSAWIGYQLCLMDTRAPDIESADQDVGFARAIGLASDVAARPRLWDPLKDVLIDILIDTYRFLWWRKRKLACRAILELASSPDARKRGRDAVVDSLTHWNTLASELPHGTKDILGIIERLREDPELSPRLAIWLYVIEGAVKRYEKDGDGVQEVLRRMEGFLNAPPNPRPDPEAVGASLRSGARGGRAVELGLNERSGVALGDWLAGNGFFYDMLARSSEDRLGLLWKSMRFFELWRDNGGGEPHPQWFFVACSYLACLAEGDALTAEGGRAKAFARHFLREVGEAERSSKLDYRIQRNALCVELDFGLYGELRHDPRALEQQIKRIDREIDRAEDPQLAAFWSACENEAPERAQQLGRALLSRNPASWKSAGERLVNLLIELSRILTPAAERSQIGASIRAAGTPKDLAAAVGQWASPPYWTSQEDLAWALALERAWQLGVEVHAELSDRLKAQMREKLFPTLDLIQDRLRIDPAQIAALKELLGAGSDSAFGAQPARKGSPDLA